MILPAGFATIIMIARFTNELCGMVEMTVINELAFPTSRQYSPQKEYFNGVRMTDRRHDSLEAGVARQSLKQLLVEAR